MRCFNLDQGKVTAGIQLWQDQPDRCFVHIRPDIWMPVRNDLLNSTMPEHIELRADGQIVLHRASTHVIANHVVEFIPETAESADRACVLGYVDKQVAAFCAAAPEPTAPYRLALGINFCTGQVMGSSRISKPEGEEYGFVVGMDAGDDIRLNLLFYPAAGAAPHGQIDPWVEGSFVRFDGKDVIYSQIESRTLADRSRAWARSSSSRNRAA